MLSLALYGAASSLMLGIEHISRDSMVSLLCCTHSSLRLLALHIQHGSEATERCMNALNHWQLNMQCGSVVMGL